MKADIRIVVALVMGASLLTSSWVLAQDPVRGRGEAQADVGGDDSASEDDDEFEEDDASDASARGSEVTEGGRKVKVYQFSGLDISGQLKSPQLLYFLNRMRAEFDRPKLPHRSFMPELRRSARSKGL